MAIRTIDNDNLPLVISFSGGETSAYMLIYLWNKYKGKRKIIVIFANTSQENEETLIFTKQMEEYYNIPIIWVEAVINKEYGIGVTHKLVDFKSCNRDGTIFQQMIDKLGIPNIAAPFCSRDLKEKPIHHYLKTKGIKKYHTAIGIRADEIDRVKSKFYPLVSLNITKPKINKFFTNHPFRLELKGYQGNCKWCWKKSLRKHLTLLNENPEYYNFPNKMEEKYSMIVPKEKQEYRKKHRKEPLKPPFYFFRNNLSVKALIEMAENFTNFAHDDSLQTYYQTSVFGDYELDVSNGCDESCEIDI